MKQKQWTQKEIRDVLTLIYTTPARVRKVTFNQLAEMTGLNRPLFYWIVQDITKLRKGTLMRISWAFNKLFPSGRVNQWDIADRERWSKPRYYGHSKEYQASYRKRRL